MSKKKKLETALQVFANENFGKIRGVMIDGEPYFVGKDVATALGYENGSRDVNRHVDEEDRLKYQIGTSGQMREMTLINESGLYSLILTSKLPKAKEFKRWVTSEVLPSIRKTGAYINPNFQDEHWLEVRLQAKETYKDIGSTKKMFIEYARSQGYKGEDGFIYGTLAIKTNKFVGLPKRGGRNNGTVPQLSVLSLIENGEKEILIKGMDEGLHYTRIIAKVDVWLEKFRKENFIDSYLNQNSKLLK